MYYARFGSTTVAVVYDLPSGDISIILTKDQDVIYLNREGKQLTSYRYFYMRKSRGTVIDQGLATETWALDFASRLINLLDRFIRENK